ncbi:DUF7352 domain-containing protein [Actinomadura alba]|uniref:DUF7352 domain-containing protein n=1 Tax=Actinomadura alba TaxID=406431 RepID=A0ABR7LHQ1_9ACTN|nr:hypothetical protein [Actinomadura alba]MBC6464274.1 hypothetical protein [Actinomadura alba]
MTKRVYRYEIPVNGRPFTRSVSGDPLHVAARRIGVSPDHRVDFWVEDRDDAPPRDRVFQVFGTGHPIPDEAQWVGTTQRTPEGFIWHLYELLDTPGDTP